MGWREAWEGIPPPWREAFLLAWDSYQAGSFAVGAVVVDESDGVVARGRNRSGERATEPGVLAGTHLAHAEVNALAALPPGDYWEHSLYTTLESCLLCTAATTHVHVGRIVYAAKDPLWEGIERLPELNPHVARRFHQRHQIDFGPLTVWAGALPMASRALHLMNGHRDDANAVFAEDVVLATMSEQEPPVASLARHFVEHGPLPGDCADLQAALSSMWSAVEVFGGDVATPEA